MLRKIQTDAVISDYHIFEKNKIKVLIAARDRQIPRQRETGPQGNLTLKTETA